MNNDADYYYIQILEDENHELQSQIANAKKRALYEFAAYCQAQSKSCKYGQTAEEWAIRADIATTYAERFVK